MVDKYDDPEFDETLRRIAILKVSQDEWADRAGKMIAQSTVKYVLVLIIWSAIAGVAVGFVLGRLF